MKVVHKNESDAPSGFSECLVHAKALEANEDTKGAINMYQKCIRLQPTNE